MADKPDSSRPAGQNQSNTPQHKLLAQGKPTGYESKVSRPATKP